MKYYIIAGEASGDLHGSNLMKALYERDANADIRFWGGDAMMAVGGTMVKHIRDLSFMGFVEVFRHIGTVLGNDKTRLMTVPVFALIGWFVVSAEPAVHVLTKQVEEIITFLHNYGHGKKGG